MSDSLWFHGQYSSLGQNTGVGSLSLLQGTSYFLTQGSNPGLPHCGQILYQLSYKGSPRILEWIAYPFSSRSSLPRNRTWVSCIAGRFFPSWAIKYIYIYLHNTIHVWVYINVYILVLGSQQNWVGNTEFSYILCPLIQAWSFPPWTSHVKVVHFSYNWRIYTDTSLSLKSTDDHRVHP